MPKLLNRWLFAACSAELFVPVLVDPVPLVPEPLPLVPLPLLPEQPPLMLDVDPVLVPVLVVPVVVVASVDGVNSDAAADAWASC